MENDYDMGYLTANITNTTDASASDDMVTDMASDDMATGRRKRSAEGEKPRRNVKMSKKPRKTNSASSILGLNILLFQNKSDYSNPPTNWEGLVQNSYLGFKVWQNDMN